MSDEPRQYFYESGHGRIDNDGVEWWKCDGLSWDNWFRWEDRHLISMLETDETFVGWRTTA